MTEIIKIAFCTDFSDASQVSFNTLVFNSWNFGCHIDLIHLVEDLDPKEAQIYLDQLRDELTPSLDIDQTITTYLFNRGELNLLLRHLNVGNYFLVLIGMKNFENKSKFGAFAHILYENVKHDIVMIPHDHKIRIENKGIVILEFKNLDNFYLTKKFEAYFNFLSTYLRILILSDGLIASSELKNSHVKIQHVLPKINFEIVNRDTANSEEFILDEISNTTYDYLMFFTGGHFDRYISKCMESGILEGRPQITFYKYFVTESLIQDIKSGNPNVPFLKLKSIS